jgi:hypothetical protein
MEIPRLLRIVFLLILSVCAAPAHVVTQLYAESKGTPDAWSMEVLFEAGFAVPAIREDPVAAAPDRQWLLAQGPDGWAALRTEAERYLRESLSVESAGQPVEWLATFIDFDSDPPGFPVLLTNGAYLRIKVVPMRPVAEPVSLKWSAGESRPTFILKTAGAEGGYLTLEPGGSGTVGGGVAEEPQTHGTLVTAFRQGFLHVVPKGWDHVLFVLGLFFYRRKWRPLLSQSLAFTAAHTVTLGLAAAGIVRVSGNWVEPVIALSLVAVALENLRASKEADGRVRLAIVFGFGLIHGLGFAGALSVWLKPGEGFLPSLLMANLGVETAQAALLAGAWVLTIGWNRTPAYRWVRLAACLGIAGIGSWWAFERIFL